MVKTTVNSVKDRTGFEEGSPTLPDRGNYILGPNDIEQGFLLTGERSFGQVLGSGRGANRNRLIMTAAQLGVGLDDVLLQSMRNLGGKQSRFDPFRCREKLLRILNHKVGQFGLDFLF